MVDCPAKCMLPCMKPCIGCGCIPCPMNCIMDCCMGCPCCTSAATGGMASPTMAKMMQPIMRYMMNGLMKVTDHNNDASYKEVQDFMVPKSAGKEFVDAPGTFDETMTPRITEIGMPMMGIKCMRMSRPEMVKQPDPHNKGITFEKFAEHRGYAMPNYEPKHPKDGEDAVDGKILSIDGNNTESTLLAEAKNIADKFDSDKVIVCFDAMTCPFYRAYAVEDLYNATKGVPKLHVYIREAEPCDVFDAGGMHCETPLKMKRYIPWHKNEAERAEAANDCKTFLEGGGFAGEVTMWMDAMDDKLEAAYEARPWRWYVLDAKTMKVVSSTGLAPFNMDGKLAKMAAATTN